MIGTVTTSRTSRTIDETVEYELEGVLVRWSLIENEIRRVYPGHEIDIPDGGLGGGRNLELPEPEGTVYRLAWEQASSDGEYAAVDLAFQHAQVRYVRRMLVERPRFTPPDVEVDEVAGPDVGSTRVPSTRWTTIR